MSESPPFPDDVPTISLPKISATKLEQQDGEEEDRLFQACIDHGCFTLDLIDGPDAAHVLTDIDRAFSIGNGYFGTPMAEKMEFIKDHRNIGYKPPGTFTHADGSADDLELFGLSEDRLMDASKGGIPSSFAVQRPFLTSLITDRFRPLCARILAILAARLEISPNTFPHLHGTDTSSPSSTILRFLHYPAAPPSSSPATSSDNNSNSNSSSSSSSSPKLLGHTDNGSLTILFTSLGGLQILPSHAAETDAAAWAFVRPERGSAFVNVGDALVQWTGGALRAALHRVVAPPGAQVAHARASFGYFLKPADEARMKRVKEGLLVVGGSESEEEEEEEKKKKGGEEEAPRYEEWHQMKSRRIYEGVNGGLSRGGDMEVAWKRRGVAA